MSALAKIHIAKKQLGLDDDTYRDMLERVTSKRSSKGMNNKQHTAVLDEFKRLGWKSDFKRKRGGGSLTGPYAKKLQALWIAGWNLGLVDNRKDAALIAFVKRQTGIQSMAWLRDPEDADKAVEALKKWLERGGVDWSVGDHIPPWARAPGFKIAWAQLRKLEPFDEFFNVNFSAAITEILPNNNGLDVLTSSDWIKVMNALGVKVRKAAK